jgi:natural product precursor
MKNIKLNKLAEKRLNEKEMRSLKGGGPQYAYHIRYNSATGAFCDSMCSCVTLPPININPVNYNGLGYVISAMDPPIQA